MALTHKETKLRKLLVLPLLLLMGCALTPESIRNHIAGQYGFIISARDQSRTECQATPTVLKCTAINRGIDAHNLSIDAYNVWCAGPPQPGNMPYGQGGPCSPQKGFESRLQAAVNSLDVIVADVKSSIR